MGKVLQQRCNNRKTSIIERCYKGREKDFSPVSELSRFTGKASPRRDLQEEILPQWQSALKWGPTGELPSPMLPQLTLPQVLNQWFRL